LYFDECFSAKQVARQLRAAGHLIYLATELGLGGADDEVQLAKGEELGAVLASEEKGLLYVAALNP